MASQVETGFHTQKAFVERDEGGDMLDAVGVEVLQLCVVEMTQRVEEVV